MFAQMLLFLARFRLQMQHWVFFLFATRLAALKHLKLNGSNLSATRTAYKNTRNPLEYSVSSDTAVFAIAR